jgi:diacylglycerol kinase (ATP)
MAVAVPAPLPASLPAPQRLRPRPRHLRSLSPHLLLVANGNASGLVRQPELVADAGRLLRSLGARVESLVTSTTDELAATLAGAERRVVLLGGDGSLHAAANAPVPLPELALLPAGGANNVARSLGVPADLAAAARLAVQGPARPLDVIEAVGDTGRYLAVEGVSVGFHALARAEYRGQNSTDVAAGLKAGLGALFRFKPITVGLSVDGEPEVARLGQLFAANMPLYGPRLRVAPGADPTDGLLDLVTLEAESKRDLLRLVPHLRRGTHLGRPGVRRVRAERVRIAAGGSSPVIADTTNLGRGTVDLTLLPAALAVVGGPR